MIITQTPLRISFAGGGTDFRDFYAREPGCVVSTAIDKYVWVIVKRRFDDDIVVNYSKKEICKSIGEIQHDLVREAMRLTGMGSGVEITTLADIPATGTGLGSSSSITVGLLHAFYAYRGELVSAEQLARQACDIEVDILGRPMGKQDQYIAAYGGLRALEFLPDETVHVDSIELDEQSRRLLDGCLMAFYTNVTRSSSSILAGQKRNIPRRFEQLRALKSHASRARDALDSGKFDDLGLCLHEGWQQKKALAAGITNPEIDEMYSRALEAGAIGGKIAGAGGGGFLLIYAPLGTQDRVRKALSGYRELPFHIGQDGSKIMFNTRHFD